MKRDIKIGYEIINDRVKKLYQIAISPIDLVDKEDLYDRYTHEIQDCLYWIKYEREKENE